MVALIIIFLTVILTVLAVIFSESSSPGWRYDQH